MGPDSEKLDGRYDNGEGYCCGGGINHGLPCVFDLGYLVDGEVDTRFTRDCSVAWDIIQKGGTKEDCKFWRVAS